METILSINKAHDKTIRYGFYEDNKCIILTSDKIIIYDVIEKTSAIYNIKHNYDDICYCSRLNCYYAVSFNKNIIYKLSPDFEIIFSIIINDLSVPLRDIYYDCSANSTFITDSSGVTEILSNKIINLNNDERILSCISNSNKVYYLVRNIEEYYVINNNLMYKLPSDYNYTSILNCITSSDSDDYTLILSAENQYSNVLLSIKSNELMYNEGDILYSVAEDEKKLAQNLFDEVTKAEISLYNSYGINSLININKSLQPVIDDIIVEEYMLYKKVYKIINGT